jgi:hypothetical protein
MKSFLSALSLFSLIAAPSFADSAYQVVVKIPTDVNGQADVDAAHEAILAAAQDVCSQVRYVGVSKYYKSSSRKKCVAATYEAALAQDTSGELVAALEKSPAAAGFIAALN